MAAAATAEVDMVEACRAKMPEGDTAAIHKVAVERPRMREGRAVMIAAVPIPTPEVRPELSSRAPTQRPGGITAVVAAAAEDTMAVVPLLQRSMGEDMVLAVAAVRPIFPNP